FFHFFFYNHIAPSDIYTLSLHDALPICLITTASVFPCFNAAALVVWRDERGIESSKNLPIELKRLLGNEATAVISTSATATNATAGPCVLFGKRNTSSSGLRIE